jgi:hypothetical protein
VVDNEDVVDKHTDSGEDSDKNEANWNTYMSSTERYDLTPSMDRTLVYELSKIGRQDISGCRTLLRSYGLNPVDAES